METFCAATETDALWKRKEDWHHAQGLCYLGTVSAPSLGQTPEPRNPPPRGSDRSSWAHSQSHHPAPTSLRSLSVPSSPLLTTLRSLSVRPPPPPKCSSSGEQSLLST